MWISFDRVCVRVELLALASLVEGILYQLVGRLPLQGCNGIFGL